MKSEPKAEETFQLKRKSLENKYKRKFQNATC